MKVRWYQPLLVVVVVVVSLCSADDDFHSLEDSREGFRPSPPILDTPFSFRPRPRGGRFFDSHGPSFPSSPSQSFFPPSSSSSSELSYSNIQSPSPSLSFSSPSSSDYSPSSSPSFSSPSLSSPSSYTTPAPSFSVGRANGVKFHDTSFQDSRESLEFAPSPSLGYTAPGISPTLNNHGVSGLISPSSQSFGPSPTPSQSYGAPSSPSQGYGSPPNLSQGYSTPSPPSHSYGAPPTPSQNYGAPTLSHGYSTPAPPSQSYGAPPPLSQTYGPPPLLSQSYTTPSPPSQSYGSPSPPSESYGPPPAPSQSYGSPPLPSQSFGSPSSLGPSYNPSSPAPHRLGSRERFSSLESFEIPDNNFGDSIETFIAPDITLPHGASLHNTFGQFDSQSIGFSSSPDRFNSRETFLPPSNSRPSSGYSAPSSNLEFSSESFHSPNNVRPPTQRFPTPSSNYLPPSNSFRAPSTGHRPAHDSGESSSSEIFLRTSGQPRPILADSGEFSSSELFLRTREQPQPILGQQTSSTSVQGTRLAKTSFVGAFPNYYFNYDVSDSGEDDGFHSSGSRKKGANFGHSERREGTRTEGRYYVELPDGRTQVVEYYADETGYHPTITYV